MEGILGRAIGGKTGRSATGWDIGVTTVNFSQSSELLNSLKMPPFLNVLEFHQDEGDMKKQLLNILSKYSKGSANNCCAFFHVTIRVFNQQRRLKTPHHLFCSFSTLTFLSQPVVLLINPFSQVARVDSNASRPIFVPNIIK
ncbi:hypothetical protein DM860_012873 [Cuscuta australis]|uniref:Uncharacterized protein n=1 Tax=Cuscuta australis TaxID=267555 RepID=A0A328DW44_9ASTE|nr:hypothetical protein DM860_012873 [Cuscuta australis]